VVTPNIPEAELLLGHAIPDGDAAEAALVELLALGAPAVLLKGGHLPGRKLIDRLDDGWQLHEFEHPRLKVEGHGTGCTLRLGDRRAAGAGAQPAGGLRRGRRLRAWRAAPCCPPRAHETGGPRPFLAPARARLKQSLCGTG
jgi:hypothetical protein